MVWEYNHFSSQADKNVMVTSTPQKQPNQLKSALESLDYSAILGKQELRIEQILDPNDITEGFMKQQECLPVNVPKYESPLDRRNG